MVDFDNETTITTDRTKIITVIILQRHSYVIDVLEEYFKFSYRGVNTANPHSGSVKAGIRALFVQLRSNMVHAGAKEIVDGVTSLLDVKGKLNDYLEAFSLLDDWLCSANLTRFIYKKQYSPRNPFAENEVKLS